MDVTITDSLLLAAVVAILAVGYVSRRVATASVARNFAQGHKDKLHFKQAKQTLFLRKRLGVLAAMLVFSALGVFAALVAVGLAALKMRFPTDIAFGVAISFTLISLLQALYESALSNKSLYMEIDAVISSDDPYYKGASA
jgi:hypothetical protein